MQCLPCRVQRPREALSTVHQSRGSMEQGKHGAVDAQSWGSSGQRKHGAVGAQSRESTERGRYGAEEAPSRGSTEQGKHRAGEAWGRKARSTGQAQSTVRQGAGDRISAGDSMSASALGKRQVRGRVLRLRVIDGCKCNREGPFVCGALARHQPRASGMAAGISGEANVSTGLAPAEGAATVKGWHQQKGAATVKGWHQQKGAATVKGWHQQKGAATVKGWHQYKGAATVKGWHQQKGAATVKGWHWCKGAATVKGWHQQKGAATVKGRHQQKGHQKATGASNRASAKGCRHQQKAPRHELPDRHLRYICRAHLRLASNMTGVLCWPACMRFQRGTSEAHPLSLRCAPAPGSSE